MGIGCSRNDLGWRDFMAISKRFWGDFNAGGARGGRPPGPFGCRARQVALSTPLRPTWHLSSSVPAPFQSRMGTRAGDRDCHGFCDHFLDWL